MDEGAEEPRAGHRADVQGLRAVAIVLVVVCHAGIALPGGFVGVDVFFVVSGYVIGALLLRELDGSGSVSMRDFYARRVRRLLPALALLIVVGVAIGILVLNPTNSQIIPFHTAGAASVFVANVYLYRHLGYFDATADGSNPFLHLWSLSVEEQFYLVLPALMLVMWKVSGRGSASGRRRRMAVLIGVLSLASFWLSWAMTTGRSPIAVDAPARFAFYGAPTRIWELGLGVLVALGAGWVARVPGRLAAVLGLVGGLLIAASAIHVDPLQPFPGLAAVPTVVGTALLLVAGARSPVVAAILSWRPMRWVGDRSYGWYLWHWPLIVFAVLLWPGSRWPPVIAAGVSLLIAALTFAVFEDRIRRRASLRGWRALALAGFCIVVPLAVVGAALHGTSGGWGVAEPLDWFDTPTGRGNGCVIVNREMANTWRSEACTTDPPGGPATGTVLVLGDYHADSLSTAVLDVAATRHLRVAEWGRAGCPFTAAPPHGYPACGEWQRKAMDLVDQLHPDLVVIGNRSTAYTTDVDRQVGSNAGRIERPDGRASRTEAQATDAWDAALNVTLRSLHERGVPVVVVGAPPGYRGTFPTPSILRPSLEPPVRSRAAVDATHDPVVAAERKAVAGIPGVAYIDPVPILCRRTCTPVQSGRWLYYDAFHLNNRGSRLLVPALSAAIDRVVPPQQ